MNKTISLTDRFHADNTIPKGDWVWVFGSNNAGKHSCGTAKVAHVTFKAKYGEGRGLTGRAYAIATKGEKGAELAIDEIADQVSSFLQFAQSSPRLGFYITRLTSEAHPEADLAKLFANAPQNCCLPQEWKPYVLPHAEAPVPKAEKTVRTNSSLDSMLA